MSQILIAGTESPSYRANILPCKIHFTGEHDASQYWKVEEDNDGQLAYFRGRKLRSVERNQVKGFILRKKDTDPDSYESVGSIEGMINWGHERVHSKNDGLEKIEEWLSVSEAIHS